MRIRRVIIPAVLALGVAGSLIAGAAMPVAAGHAPGARSHVVAAAPTSVHYHN